MPAIQEPGGAKRECTYQLLRNRQRPQLLCAVAADCPLPGFLVPEQWLRDDPLCPSDVAPPGFQERAAVTGMQLKGYHLFQELRTARELGQSLDTAWTRAA